MFKPWVWSQGWEDPLEKGMATHLSILAWRIPWTEEPGGLLFMGSQRVGHNWATRQPYIVAPYCYFNFQFPNDLWSCGALCIYLTFVYIFFGRCPGFLHIFNWAIVFLIVEFWVIYIFLLVRLGQKGPKMEVRGNGDQKIHVEGEQRKEKACPKGKP